MTIQVEFYKSLHAGQRYFEQLDRQAVADAQNVQVYYYQLALAYYAKQSLPELEAMQAELKSKCDDLSKRIASLDKQIQAAHPRDQNKLLAERDGGAREYTRERAALDQVGVALRYLRSIKEPVTPPWLVSVKVTVCD